MNDDAPTNTPPANTPPTETPRLYLGIDLAKDEFLTHALPEGPRLTLPNSPPGFRQLLEQLPAPGGCLIVLEATGGYERPLVAELLQAGYRVALVQPRRVRSFADAHGIHAKNDRLDAYVLARFAQDVQPRTLAPTPQQQTELEQLVLRRRQLVELRTMESNRLALAHTQASRQSIQRVLAFLQRQIDKLEADIAHLIRNDDDWRQKNQLLQSVPGIGPVTAASLLADLPELGSANRQKIAALAGLAPYDDDSGPRHGPRTIRGGRQPVRNVLYMAALAARRANPAIRAFAQRLEQQGKPFKKVITACMRKLLVILNTLLKTNQPWTNKLAPQTP